MPITLKDLARLANVSHTTVSRALNGSPSVKIETRQRIQELARELQYVPNISAKGLVSARSYLLGMFSTKSLQSLHTAFLQEILAGIDETLDASYSVVLKSFGHIEDMEADIRYRHYDGILFVCIGKSDLEYIYKLLSMKVRFLVLNRNTQDIGVPCVSVDEYGGTQEAVNYLIEHGHRKIAIVKGSNTYITTDLRFSAYKDAMLRRGLELRDEYIQEGMGGNPQSGYIAMEKMLALPDPPTAVYVSNDYLAVGVMKACYRHNFKVPENMSVISFDGNEFSEYLIPSLSTVIKPRTEMGRISARLLIGAIGAGTQVQSSALLQTKLIIRESCANPNS